MKALKKFSIILLVFALVVSMVPVCFSAEVGEEDTYVLHRDVEGDSYDGKVYVYASRYVADPIYDSKPDYSMTSYIYAMYDTRNNKVIPTYCTDIKTTAYSGSIYRRLNLEDSSFAGDAAGQIRSIVRNGFYINPDNYATSADHEAAVNNRVAKLGEAAGVPDLTLSEAISATQCAIWQTAHGQILSFSSFVRKYPYQIQENFVEYATLCKKEPDGLSYYSGYLQDDSITFLNKRIRTVYDYLLSLDPLGPSSQVVSPASFINLNDPIFTDNGDGTYSVSVTTTVNVSMEPNDSLTLEATLGNMSESVSLKDGQETHTLKLSDVPASLYGQDVQLTISGYQTASDVFLFDALDGRETSQAMVGMDDSQLPVYARVVAGESRVLNIEKTTSSGVALEGIIFDIYPVATLDEYLSGAKELPEPENCTHPELADYTVITDKYGNASLNLTQHGLPDGVYLVVERQHPAIVRPIDPFYVILPATNVQGTGYDYAVTVSPKNEVKGGVRIGKDVVSLGNDSASVDAYENHTWIISATIPEDIATGKSYTISDTLNNCLDYIGNVKITVEATDGTTVSATLTEGADYTVAVNDVDSLSENKPSDSIVFQLTPSGMSAVAAAVNNGTKNFSDYMLRVYFDAQVNANAVIAKEIPNQAVLTYTNSVNFTFDATSDIPVVYTGAANLLKVDANDNTQKLEGAVFEVYRPAKEDEVDADYAITIDGISGKVVKVSFFDNASMTGEKVSSVTSDENGKVAIYGLAYGKYYLKEIKAPDGYNLLKSPLNLTINENSHMEANSIKIENVSGTILPETGGFGTTAYTLTGITLMAVSILLMIEKKRRTLHVGN